MRARRRLRRGSSGDRWPWTAALGVAVVFLGLHSAGAAGGEHYMRALGMQRLDGQKAFDFSLPGMDGKTTRLSEFRGKVVFLNFWASWCPACRVEMPAMEALHRRFEGRDFAILAVAINARGRRVVSPFVKEFGLTFRVLLDPENRVMDQYRVTLIPTTFIVGRGGELLAKVIGPKAWDGEDAIRLFESLLRRGAASSARDGKEKRP